jgi:hypothetical protein
MKKFSLLLATALTTIVSPAFAQFNASGTEYDTANTSIWTEDKANEVVQYANEFACIISNSRGDLFGNGSWEALIDEGDCFNADTDSRGGPQYAQSLMTSTRASENDPQNVVAFFTSRMDDYEQKFIANISGRQSPVDAAPFGDWSFSFRLAASEQFPDFESTAANAPAFGFVNITEDDAANTVQIISADGARNPLSPNVLVDSTRSIIRLDRGEDTGEFIGVTTGEDANSDNVIAGKTSGSHYYRVEWTGVDASDLSNLGAASSSACVSRGNSYQTVHKYGLFNNSTGERIDLSGGFGFSYGGSDANRGYAGNWGVWFENEGSTSFSPSSPSLAITPNDEDITAASFSWAGGKTYKTSVLTEELLDGTSYLTWTSEGEAVATYNSGAQQFALTPVNDGVAFTDTSLTRDEVIAEPWLGNFWSNEKQASVQWDGGANVTFYVREDLSLDAALTAATSTKFVSLYSGPPASNLPIERASVASQNYKGDTNIDAGEVYFLTGLTPGGSFEPRTMYHDTNDDDTLSSGDTAVRYNFSVSSMDGEYTDFADDGTGSYSGSWPYDSVSLVKADDFGIGSCANNALESCDKYEWSFGAYTWDQSFASLESDGDIYQIDQPIRFEYTYDADAHDRNDASTDVEFATNSQYNPVANHCPATIGDGVGCAIAPNDLDGKKYYLEFDGTSLHGLPGVETGVGEDGWSHWIQLINLEDGLQLNDVSNVPYRVKALEISETLGIASADDCSAITFSSLADLTLSTSDLPDPLSPAVAIPTETWSEAPATDDLICTVTHGDASQCTTQ